MLDPNSSLTYGNRGNAYYEIGDYDRAIADYKAGLQIDPDNATLKKYLKYVQQLIDD
jgi:tetratricopeptide (TPR) repeat protein